MAEQLNARDLFRAAYENRYTWDENFPGYSATLELKQGEETYTGQIRIYPDFSVELTGIENEEVQQSVNAQLRDVVTHRKRSPFEQVHQKNQFSLGEQDETGALEILVNGNAMGSHYKIRGAEICHVSRAMGKMLFEIDTQATLDTGTGYVPTRYNVVFRNTETNQIESERQQEDDYTQIGNYYILTRQVLRSPLALGFAQSRSAGQETVTEFNFSHIKLLEPAIAVV